MQLSMPSWRSEVALFLGVLLAAAPANAMLRCEQMRADDTNFNLSKLGGPHSVVTSRWHDPAYTNTTYTIDICSPLKRDGDVAKGDQCPNGSRVCAIQHLIRPDGDDPTKSHEDIEGVIPIAGNLKDQGGGDLDPKLQRLKTSDSNSDAEKEGLRLILQGGRYPLHGKHRRPQKAIIEFLCDREKTGLEGETTPEEKYAKAEKKVKAREDDKKDDDKEDDKKDKGDDDDNSEDDGEDDGKNGEETQILQPDAALIWNSYGPDEKGDSDVLRMTWHTKYACEDAYGKPDDDDGSPGDSSSSWGFFTWFLLIAFLGIAAYLIFGSWLNYNRYGARGWDLLPHGDTIRDTPYILKDLARSMLNSVQGSGTRGGYSAL